MIGVPFNRNIIQCTVRAALCNGNRIDVFAIHLTAVCIERDRD